jgi:NAD(P)-dependent dehydrogenase (short-subunit alcohol dehydrogenase family)
VEGKSIPITLAGSGIGLEHARRLTAGNWGVSGRHESKLEGRAAASALRTLRLDVPSENGARRGIHWIASDPRPRAHTAWPETRVRVGDPGAFHQQRSTGYRR